MDTGKIIFLAQALETSRRMSFEVSGHPDSFSVATKGLCYLPRSRAETIAQRLNEAIRPILDDLENELERELGGQAK